MGNPTPMLQGVGTRESARVADERQMALDCPMARLAAVVFLVGDGAGLGARVVHQHRLGGEVQWSVGQDVEAGPLHHHTIGGEEEDGVLGGTPGTVVHRGVDCHRAVVARSAVVVDRLGGGHLGAGVGHLALHGVVGQELTLPGEQVDVADLVSFGVADEALAQVHALEPAALLHLLERVGNSLDRCLAVLLGDLLGGSLGGVFLGAAAAGDGGEADACDE